MFKLPSPEDLRRKRHELHLTQSEVAKMAGLSQPMIARIESGDVDPRLSTIKRIVDALNRAEERRAIVKDIMHSPVIGVSPDEPVMKAVSIMESHGFSQIPVLREGVCVGSISVGLITEYITKYGAENVRNKRVDELMDEPLPTVPIITDISTVSKMLDTHLAVLVVEMGRVIGVITKHDIMKLISMEEEHENE
ncbi:transcriptional regulator [Methanosarcinales archaeon]|nr:MAG: transcriptional regulator [Methanosarcinales archaeon]